MSNRVRFINSWVDKKNWYYVEGSRNPADFGTRGLSAMKFLSLSCWKKGPELLYNYELFKEYVGTSFRPVERIPEMKEEMTNLNVVTVSESILLILNKFSSFFKVVNIVSYVCRFIDNTKFRVAVRKGLKSVRTSVDSNALSVSQREAGFYAILRFVQMEYFRNEYDSMLKGISVDKKSKLFAFNPFIDEKKVIRIRGRISRAEFSFDTKYPIAIPVKCKFIELYVTYVHVKFYHASISFMLHFIRAKFWVVGNLLSYLKICLFVNVSLSFGLMLNA